MNTRLPFAPALTLTLTLAAATTLLAGCNFQLGSSTPGEDSRAQFAYADLDCLFGCDTSRAMMTGTTESLSITGASLPAGLTLTNDSPGVVTATLTQSPQCCIDVATQNGGSGGCFSVQPGDPCSGTFDPGYSANLVAVSPGDATITLLAADASVFDAVVLHVAAPASIQFSCAVGGGASAPVTALSLPAGQTCSFHVDAFDAAHAPLIASEGFDIESSDQTIATATPFIFIQIGLGPIPPVLDADGSINAVTPGTGSIAIKAGGIAQVVPVTVH